VCLTMRVECASSGCVGCGCPVRPANRLWGVEILSISDTVTDKDNEERCRRGDQAYHRVGDGLRIDSGCRRGGLIYLTMSSGEPVEHYYVKRSRAGFRTDIDWNPA